MAKFSDTPYYILSEFCSNLIPTSFTYPTSAHLVGPRTTIVPNTSYGMTCFLKTDEGYKRVKGRFIEETESKNQFSFTYETSASVYRGSELTMDEFRDESGGELYFMKDMPFYYFINNDEDYLKFMNTNKLFSYFGAVYPHETEERFNVICTTYKDHVIRALPENNRTDLLELLLTLFYDRIYNEIYNKAKNTWTLSDPYECDEDYLYYISEMYRMNIFEDLSVEKQRAYIANLPALLKHKGSYASLYLIWKTILPYTTNYLNIYERWHNRDVVGTPYSYFNDVRYLELPDYNSVSPSGGAGAYYYGTYTSSGGYPSGYGPSASQVLSTHYKVEMDLSIEPLGEDFIIDEETVDNLMVGWEAMRPVTKVAHYCELLSPNCDFTGQSYSLYGTGYSAGLISKCITPVYSPEAGCAVYSRWASSETWVINHGLNSYDVIVQCFDMDGNQMWPATIDIVGLNIIRLTWAYAVAGSTFLSLANSTTTIEASAAATTWNLTHALSQKYVFAQIEDLNKSALIPLSVTMDSTSAITVNFIENTSGYVQLAWEAGDWDSGDLSSSTTWLLNHNLNAAAVQVQCFDASDNIVFPTDITIDSFNTVIVTFAEATAGRAIIRKIGQSSDSMAAVATSMSYLKLGTGVSKNDYNATYYNDLEIPLSTRYPVTVYEDTEYYYTVADIINNTEDITFTEIGIFSSTDELMFYTYNSDFYKPSGVDLRVWYRILKKAI